MNAAPARKIGETLSRATPAPWESPPSRRRAALPAPAGSRGTAGGVVGVGTRDARHFLSVGYGRAPADCRCESNALRGTDARPARAVVRRSARLAVLSGRVSTSLASLTERETSCEKWRAGSRALDRISARPSSPRP